MISRTSQGGTLPSTLLLLLLLPAYPPL